MLTQKIAFYFTEKCLREAFLSCFSVLSNHLNTEKAFNLVENVIIHDLNEELEEYSDFQILIDCNTLKEQIEYLFDSYDISIESIFLSDEQIREKIADMDRELEEDQEEHDKLQLHIQFDCESCSDCETLLLIHYANKISLELTEINEHESENILKYEDLDYSELDSFIEIYLHESYIIQSFIQTHYDSNEHYFDTYYDVSVIPDHF
jgi:hypothetical protein